jgi:hypothetical protein
MYNTIEGFESLTRQQVFDLSTSHILKTKQKSVSVTKVPGSDEPAENCVYGGIGCAASVFLKDDATRIKCDEMAVRAGGSSWYVLAQNRLVATTNYSTISALQQAHDSIRNDADFFENWKKRMVKFAKDHSLDASILDQANVC